MKKLAVSLAAGALTAGIATTSVSAQEYEVKQGDSLWKIANKHHSTVDELMKVNDLSNTIIHPKQTLQVNEKQQEDADEYVVHKGDTLSEISVKVGTSVRELKDWNDLSSDLILVGQKLKTDGEASGQEMSTDESTAKEETVADTQVVEEESVEDTQANEETSVETEEVSESQSEEKQNESQSNTPEGQTISVTATAYTASCDGCSGVTATGVNLNEDQNAKVIAVDPDVIPLGSEVYVEGYGRATAADTGGNINGNKIDLHVPSEKEALNWGVQSVDVTVIN